jgi:hypothetical protein
MTETIRALLDGLIDYAGLFPPAKLDMSPALENFARDSMGIHAFALGRFICPVTRLDELTQKGAPLMPGTHATSGYPEMAAQRSPWKLSAIIDGPLDRCLSAVDAFNEHHSREDNGRAEIDALEMRIQDPQDFDEALEIIPNDITPYFEIATKTDPRGMIAALAGEDACAKVRLGGVIPDAIPPLGPVLAFIAACNSAHVPFKATAGLHHPLRAEQPLTYEDNPPRSIMHGFVNIFLTAAMLSERVIDESAAADLLAETDPAAFTWTDEAVTWRDSVLTLDALTRSRARFAHSYGSCSFDEPIADLKSLGWL